jgi:hypothetical protein
LEPGIIALPIVSLYRITSLCFRFIHFWWNQSIIKLFRQNHIDTKWNNYGFVHYYINNCSILLEQDIIALPIERFYRTTSLCFRNINFLWNQSIINTRWQKSQLMTLIPPSYYLGEHKLNILWTWEIYWMVHIRQFSQILDETISFQVKGSTWVHFWHSQPLRTPIDDTSTTKPLPWSAQTQHLVDMTKLLHDIYSPVFSNIGWNYFLTW